MAWPRMIVLALTGVAVICSCTIVLIYLVTLDETLLSSWLVDPATSAWRVFAIFWIFQFVFPVALALGTITLWTSGYSRAGYVLLFGATWGIWASATFLIVPYFGAYISLPAALVGAALSGWTNMGPWYYLGMIVANMVFWSVGLAFINMIVRWARVG